MFYSLSWKTTLTNLSPPWLKKSLNFKLKKSGRLNFFRNNVPILFKIAEVVKFNVTDVLNFIRRFSDDFGASGRGHNVEKKSWFSFFWKWASVTGPKFIRESLYKIQHIDNNKFNNFRNFEHNWNIISQKI